MYVKMLQTHQFEPWTDPQCTDPTHSLLSKDHFSNRLNPPCGMIASNVVKYVVPRVVFAWENPNTPVAMVLDDIVRVFHHPSKRDPNLELHTIMFKSVQDWVNRLPDRGAKLNEQLNAEGVRTGKNHTSGIVGGGQDGGHGKVKGNDIERVVGRVKRKKQSSQSGDIDPLKQIAGLISGKSSLKDVIGTLVAAGTSSVAEGVGATEYTKKKKDKYRDDYDRDDPYARERRKKDKDRDYDDDGPDRSDRTERKHRKSASIDKSDRDRYRDDRDRPREERDRPREERDRPRDEYKADRKARKEESRKQRHKHSSRDSDSSDSSDSEREPALAFGDDGGKDRKRGSKKSSSRSKHQDRSVEDSPNEQYGSSRAPPDYEYEPRESYEQHSGHQQQPYHPGYPHDLHPTEGHPGYPTEPGEGNVAGYNRAPSPYAPPGGQNRAPSPYAPPGGQNRAPSPYAPPGGQGGYNHASSPYASPGGYQPPQHTAPYPSGNAEPYSVPGGYVIHPDGNVGRERDYHGGSGTGASYEYPDEQSYGAPPPHQDFGYVSGGYGDYSGEGHQSYGGHGYDYDYGRHSQ